MIKLSQGLFVTLSLTLILVGLIGGFDGSGFFVLVVVPFIALTLLLFQKNSKKQYTYSGLVISLKAVKDTLKDDIKYVKADMKRDIESNREQMKYLQDHIAHLLEEQQKLNTKLTMSGIVKR